MEYAIKIPLIADKVRRIPLYESRVACGFPSPAADYIEKQLSLDEHLIKNPSSTFFVKSSGDSMSPNIQQGDLLLIDRSLKAQSGSIVLAVLNGEFTVKKLLIRSCKWFLVPQNPRHSTIEVDEEMDFQVWGVVSFVIRKVLVS